MHYRVVIDYIRNEERVKQITEEISGVIVANEPAYETISVYKVE